jgi:hypothetical protein
MLEIIDLTTAVLRQCFDGYSSKFSSQLQKVVGTVNLVVILSKWLPMCYPSSRASQSAVFSLSGSQHLLLAS